MRTLLLLLSLSVSAAGQACIELSGSGHRQ